MASLLESTRNRVEDFVRAEVYDTGQLAKVAFQSGVYLYPFKGIVYFVSHRELWRPLSSQLAPTLSIASTVVIAMFILTYIPQAAVLTLVNGPIAIVSTIFLVLSESSAITNLIARSFNLDDALVDTFDGTLISRNMTELVTHGREVKPASNSSDAVARLGKLIKSPFRRFTTTAILRYLFYLPLNFIPVIGPIVFLVLQAKRVGPQYHTRYFQLKGMMRTQKDGWVDGRRAEYTSFGVPAILLEMIPFVGIFFMFTNYVGAALWAADMERSSPAPGEGDRVRGKNNDDSYEKAD